MRQIRFKRGNSRSSFVPSNDFVHEKRLVLVDRAFQYSSPLNIARVHCQIPDSQTCLETRLVVWVFPTNRFNSFSPPPFPLSTPSFQSDGIAFEERIPSNYSREIYRDIQILLAGEEKKKKGKKKKTDLDFPPRFPIDPTIIQQRQRDERSPDTCSVGSFGRSRLKDIGRDKTIRDKGG